MCNVKSKVEVFNEAFISSCIEVPMLLFPSCLHAVKVRLSFRFRPSVLLHFQLESDTADSLDGIGFHYVADSVSVCES